MGAMIAVIIPVKIRANVLTATCFSDPFSAHADVPITCVVEPMASPVAISLLILNNFNNLCPKTAPKTPVITTMQAVKVGNPFIILEISTAIGLVVDFGIKEARTTKSVLNKNAIK